MFRGLLALVLMVGVAAGGACPRAARALDGAADPAFAAARAAWLADDEATALPALSELARGGNAAAQVLLALIDKTPALQGPWLSALPRGERVALMRAPGGMSGLSWMRIAAEREPLAAHWVTLWSVDAPVSVVLDFGRAGESRAAREAVAALASRQRDGLAALVDDPAFPAEMRAPVWAEWSADPALATRRAAELAALPPGDPLRVQLGEPVDQGALVDWAAQARLALGLRGLCATACPGEAMAACLGAAVSVVPVYPILATFGSPVESLIPAEEFADSPRGQSALARQILLTVDARLRRPMLAEIAGQSSCLAQRLELEQARYRPAPRPPMPR